MFAGAQLGITVSSILLGRLGEPAVADLLRRPFDFVGGVSPALLHTVSLAVALAIVVTLHVLLGEMVPKNIAMAGPEKAAMLLIPAYLMYVRTVRPIIAFYNRCTNATLRALRVRPRDELDVTVSTVELSEMIAESVSEGLLDPEEHTRLTRALQIRNRLVADVAVPVSQIRAVPVAGPGSGPRSRRSKRRWPQPVTPGSRSSTSTADSSDTCTSKMCCPWVITRTPWSTWRGFGRCRKFPNRCRCPKRCRGCVAARAIWRWSPGRTGQWSRWWHWKTWSGTWSASVRDGMQRV